MTRPNSELGRLLETFFRQRLAAQRGASPTTIAAYRDALRMFLIFVAERVGHRPSDLAVDELDRDTVLAFLDHLEKGRGNSTRTRNARLTAIRSFFVHVSYSDPAHVAIAQRVLSIPFKRMNKASVGYLQHAELQAVLQVPDRSSLSGRRHHALLLFMSRTGARVSEAIGVNVGDLRFDRPWQVRLRGKGSKERVVPLAEDAADILRELCAERGSLGPKDPVFVNIRGKRLSRYGAAHILRRALEVASKSQPSLLKRQVSPHTLRHTLAMHLLQAGVDLVTIQAWLGHAGVQTTHQYVEADLDMKQRALDQCDDEPAAPARYHPTDQVLAVLESL